MPLGLFVNRFVCSGLKGKKQGGCRKSEKHCMFWESRFSFVAKPRPSRPRHLACKLMETIVKAGIAMIAGRKLRAGSKRQVNCSYSMAATGWSTLCRFPLN
jgi:hypothetical protein